MDKIRIPLWMLETIVNKMCFTDGKAKIELTTDKGNVYHFTPSKTSAGVEVVDIELNPGD